MSERILQIHDTPLSFRDAAFIAVAARLTSVKTGDKGRKIECDIQAAWDAAEAMASWRDKMTKQSQ